ncbi:MAG: Hpt domain-containing protein [candidate division NC10 bacterium]|nr:Hpt domain-containing protein [candidate division NC10 bacterium]
METVTDQQDREFMMSVFLMEAWDTLASIEDSVSRLLDPAGATDGWLASVLLVTHRLKGSAALYGFPGISGLAGVMERILERTPGASLEERRLAAASFGDLVSFLRKVLDGIGANGREETEEIAVFTTRYATLFSSPSPEPAPVEPAPLLEPSTATDETSERLFEELDIFFSENGEILAYFSPEAAEHVEAMTKSLLALERTGPNEEELATLFRAVHTLKGAAYTVGFTAVGNLAHKIEDLLAAVREDRVPLSSSVIEGVFVGVDALKLLLGSIEAPPDNLPSVLSRAVESLDALMTAAEHPKPLAGALSPLPDRETVELVRTEEPEPALYELPLLPEVLKAPVAEAERQAHATADLFGLDAPLSVEPAPTERPEVGRRKGRERTTGPIRHSVRVNLDRLDSLMNLVGELVIARHRLERRLLQLDRVGELLFFSRSRMAQIVRDFEGKHQYRSLPMASASPGDSGGALGASPPVPGEAVPAAQLFAELEFDRYDDFNIFARSAAEISADISEVQAELAGLIGVVREDTSQIQRLTGGLRNDITKARMVPIGTLFARFARQVREAAKAVGKTVALEVSGESVEVDNTIIEQIADPILHLVQNAISHGIETEEDRRSRGKPPHGTVYLSAYHQGGFVYVEVEDDGQGIDASALKEQAISQGFLRAEVAPLLSEREAMDLIFLQGFSTARFVTTASGRGVGMDVVRTNVSRLNGEIDVESEVGVGTRFTIKLPLTIIISDALMVSVGTEDLAIPLAAVRIILTVSPEEIQSVGRAEMVRVEDQLIDLIRMDRLLDLPESEARVRIPVVVLRAGGKSLAVVVDELLGKEEIVIKSLGGFLEGVGPFAGATISGEGRVILLLDPMRLLEAGDGASNAAGATMVRAPGEHVAVPPRRQPDAGRRVLLVDDSVSVRKFVGQMLERAGFRVTTANDGAEALQYLAETSVDAVITDLEMPRINGYELIEDLRRRPLTRDIPVVILTTRAGEKHLNLARRLGVKHYVTKPVDEHAFVQLIDSLVSQSLVVADLSRAAR